MPKASKFLKEDFEAIYAYSGASGYQPGLNSDEEEESKSVDVQICPDDGSKVTKKEDNGLKEKKEKDKQMTGLSEKRTAKESTSVVSSDAKNSIINVKNEDPEVTIYESGLQNGFVYFNGFAINNWIIIYLVRVNLSYNFIPNHLTALLESAKSQGIPLGMPSKRYVFTLKSDGEKLKQTTKNEVFKVLTTSGHKKVQMAMIYAPNNIDLEELIAEITPMYSFRIITGYFTINYGITRILKSLLFLVKEYKKVPVMGIATRMHDGQLMIARSLNNPETGAKFDEPSLHRLKLTIVPDSQWNEQLVSMILDYIRKKSFEKLVIYRSDGLVSYQNEVSEIQKLMEQSGSRITYVVVKQIVSGSNQPIFEKLVDGIGFTDEEMTQLSAEVSFLSQKKGIPAPLAMAQMSIARMVVHYDGFKQSEYYKQVAGVENVLDQKVYKTVRKYFKSCFSESTAKKKKAVGQLNADQMKNIKQESDQKTNKVVSVDVEAMYTYSGGNGYELRLNSDEEEEGRTVDIQICADGEPKVKKKDEQKTGLSERRTAMKSTLVSSDAKSSTTNVKNEDPEVTIYKSGLQNGFVYFNGFAINKWIIIYLVKLALTAEFIDNHLTTLLDWAQSQGIPLGLPSKYYVFSLESEGKKLAQETKEEIVQVLTTSGHMQGAMICTPNNIDFEELLAEITPTYNYRIIPRFFIVNDELTEILQGFRSFVRKHKKLPVMGIATQMHDGHVMFAQTLNNPKTGAQFDEPSFHRLKLTIVPDSQWNEQLVSMILDYIRKKSFEKLVIYRSDAPVSHLNEVSDIRTLMEQSGTRFTYIVAKEIASGSNQPNFEKVVDGIGFTDEEMTQLTAEVSFLSQKKGIPAPLAMAQMSLARMVVHYNGFKQSENYKQAVRIYNVLDQKAYKAVKKYLKRLPSDTKAKTIKEEAQSQVFE